jgi:hypothetical protein
LNQWRRASGTLGMRGRFTLPKTSRLALGALVLAAAGLGWIPVTGLGEPGGTPRADGRPEPTAVPRAPVLVGAGRPPPAKPDAPKPGYVADREAPTPQATTAVAGRVVARPGVRVGRLYVHLSEAGGRELEGGSWNEVLSDVGEFRFEGVPEGTRVRVDVRPVRREEDDFRYACVDDVPAGREDLVLVVEPAGRIRGTVVEASGRPRPHADVRAYEARGVANDAFLGYAECDDAGAFELRRLPVGPVLLVANRPAGGGESDPARIDVPANGVRLILAPGHPISGRLLGDGDLSKFEVWTWRADGVKDDAERERPTADGEFTIDGIAAEGRWMVAARAHGDERIALGGPFAPDTSGVKLRLDVAPALSGTVVTADAGALPKDVRVTASGAHLYLNAQADAQGRWHFRGLLPGRYRLSVESYGEQRYGTSEEEAVDAGRTDVRLTLPLAGQAGDRSRDFVRK